MTTSIMRTDAPITNLNSERNLTAEGITIYSRGTPFGFISDRFLISSDYRSGSHFEGDLFVANKQLFDYQFLENTESSILLINGTESLNISIIPEANSYSLALGMIGIILIALKRVFYGKETLRVKTGLME